MLFKRHTQRLICQVSGAGSAVWKVLSETHLLILESLPERQEVIGTPLGTEMQTAAICMISLYCADTAAGRYQFGIPPIAYKHQGLAPTTSKPAATTQVRASRPTGLRVRLASSMPTVESPTMTERCMHLSTQGNPWSISVWWSEGSVLLGSLRPLIQFWEM